MQYYDNLSNEDKIIYNKLLVKKYPFLYLKNSYSVFTDKNEYFSTWLDDMPSGWRIAFGELLCEDIKNELIKFDYLDRYQIVQIKEKFGGLRWYDNGVPKGCKVHDILEAYSLISENICMDCGEINVPMTTGSWMYPSCKNCFINNRDYSYVQDPVKIKKIKEKNTKFWDVCYEDQSPISLPTEMKFRTYENHEFKDVTVDISNYANKIIKRYNELHNK